jgi:hypothetical protein
VEEVLRGEDRGPTVIVGLIALVSDAVLRGGLRTHGRSRGKGAAAALALVVLLVFAVLAPLAAWLV